MFYSLCYCRLFKKKKRFFQRTRRVEPRLNQQELQNTIPPPGNDRANNENWEEAAKKGRLLLYTLKKTDQTDDIHPKMTVMGGKKIKQEMDKTKKKHFDY